MYRDLPFEQPKGRMIASVDFFLEPDGSIYAVPNESGQELMSRMTCSDKDKLVRTAIIVMKGAEGLGLRADQLSE